MDENDISSEINEWPEELEATHQNKAKQLLLRYTSIFDKNDSKPGRIKVVKHFINIGDARPIRQARSVLLERLTDQVLKGFQ